MTYKALYFEAAREDVKQAKAWYKKQLPGLEKRFAVAVKEAIINLCKQPHSYTVRYKNIRIAHPRKFPYNIHFYIDNDNIVITAILFEGRDPDFPISRAE